MVFGVAVVLYRGRLHIYGSVVDGARGDSSERRELEYVTEAVEGIDCQGPMTVKWGWGQSCDREGEEGGASLSASPWLWMLDEPLQCDIYVVFLFAGHRVAADLSVLNGR